MNVEKELLKATKIKAKQYEDRQELLSAVVRSVNKLDKENYDNLPDLALDWYELAVKAMNAKKEVPDFDEVEVAEAPPRDPDDDEDEGEGDEDEGDEDAPTDAAPGEDAEDDEQDGETEETVEASAGAEPAEPDGELDPSDDELEPVPEDAPKPKKKTGRPKKAKPPRAPTRYDNLTGEKNRYGKYAGTKIDDVIKMLEKGATQAQIKAAVGDTKYNLVRWLEKEGHLIEKDGTKRTLTHKDDVKKAKKSK